MPTRNLGTRKQFTCSQLRKTKPFRFLLQLFDNAEKQLRGTFCDKQGFQE